MELNRLDYAGTRRGKWDEPALKDFGVGSQWDDLSREQQREVEDNFLINKGESPPENFGDLALPVVDPNGDLDPSNDELSKSAVDNADSRVNQVEGVSQDLRDRANRRIDTLQVEEFGADPGEAFE